MIRFRFVEDHRAEFPVERMCELVEVPRSSFYAWRNHTPSRRAVDDADLVEVIREIWTASRGTYGIPRVLGQLRRRGRPVARSRVARLMRANGMRGAHTRRRWKKIRPDGAPTEDLLNRDFTATGPNLRWVTDFTMFPTGEGKLHLVAIRTCSITASWGGAPATPRTRCWPCRP